MLLCFIIPCGTPQGRLRCFYRQLEPFCQSDSLALSSATVPPGGTASLALSLTASAGSQPAGMEWTVSYSTSDVIAITASVGAASTGAGKSISCAGNSGAYTCLLSGLNTNTIQTGVVAIISVTVASSTVSTAVNITNSLGSSVAGQAVPVTSAGGCNKRGLPRSASPGLQSYICSFWCVRPRVPPH